MSATPRREAVVDGEPGAFEAEHVQRVYDAIAPHFSHTRGAIWPKVRDFLDSHANGSIVADVGCGNGKYLGISKHVFVHGNDVSVPLVELARRRCSPAALKKAEEEDPLLLSSHVSRVAGIGGDVFACDGLRIAARDNVYDGAISIAVVHHMSTRGRRIAALRELLRVVRPGARIMVYVWSFEPMRDRRGVTFQDVFVPWNLQKRFWSNDTTRHAGELERGKSGELVYERYYHLFENGELDALFEEAGGCVVRESYFDHANWVVVAEKLSS